MAEAVQVGQGGHPDRDATRRGDATQSIGIASARGQRLGVSDAQLP